MPSVLVEAGFLSSEKDRARVLSPVGQEQISGAIFRAIDLFRRRSVSTCKVN
jgi:N-acetylmuramoyl-L-alanine amidase